MDESAYMMEAIAGVVFLIVGVRLYRLSRRTGQAPEYFIALTFLLWALGYALYDIPYAFAEGDESIAPFFAYTSNVITRVPFTVIENAEIQTRLVENFGCFSSNVGKTSVV